MTKVEDLECQMNPFSRFSSMYSWNVTSSSYMINCRWIQMGVAYLLQGQVCNHIINALMKCQHFSSQIVLVVFVLKQNFMLCDTYSVKIK
jgi:hypothetical protein